MSLAFDGLIAKAEPGHFSHQSRNVPTSTLRDSRDVPTSTLREYILFLGCLQPH